MRHVAREFFILYTCLGTFPPPPPGSFWRSNRSRRSPGQNWNGILETFPSRTGARDKRSSTGINRLKSALGSLARMLLTDVDATSSRVDVLFHYSYRAPALLSPAYDVLVLFISRFSPSRLPREMWHRLWRPIRAWIFAMDFIANMLEALRKRFLSSKRKFE